MPLQVGDILKDRFDAAAEVRLVHTANGQRAELQRRHVVFKEPTESDLVYSESSPDYCHQRADASGRFVTSGRRSDSFRGLMKIEQHTEYSDATQQVLA